MASLELHFYSNVLETTASVTVILPEPEVKTEPEVLYLLHGMGGDHTVWSRRTAVERYAGAKGLMVIMPGVQNSYYCNQAVGQRYWDYVSDELPRVMRGYFRMSDGPAYVAGLSMGGYGAMRLALTCPERFAAAGSFSGAVTALSAPPEEPREPHWRAILGETGSGAGTELDLMYLLRKNAGAERKPRLYVSCGTADALYPQHQRFVPALRAAGWDVTAREKPGAGHEWAFWDEEIERFIDFACGR